MSHFAVLVIIENALEQMPDIIPGEVDKLLAPFMENCCAEPDKMYMKFYDEEDEYLKQYEEGGQEKVVMPDGRLLLPWDETFRQKATEKEPFPDCKAPDDLPRKLVPFKETYSTFEDFVAGYCGHKERDETYLRYGYWQNPNAKWDWFEIGGRWAGFFQLKPGHIGGLGKQYNFTGELGESNDKADVCFKNAIDFDAMRKVSEDAAARIYDHIHKIIEGTPEAESWESVRSEFDLNKEEEANKARKKYNSQPRVKAFTEYARSEEGWKSLGWMDQVESFQVPREQYLSNARNSAAVPFAILKDGKWIERGDMGYWGVVSNEKDPETWQAMVQKMYDELPEQTLMVICDCHI